MYMCMYKTESLIDLKRVWGCKLTAYFTLIYNVSLLLLSAYLCSVVVLSGSRLMSERGFSNEDGLTHNLN